MVEKNTLVEYTVKTCSEMSRTTFLSLSSSPTLLSLTVICRAARLVDSQRSKGQTLKTCEKWFSFSIVANKTVQKRNQPQSPSSVTLLFKCLLNESSSSSSLFSSFFSLFSALDFLSPSKLPSSLQILIFSSFRE